MITLLDGGMGQELIGRSKNDPTSLWSTGVMISEPHLVHEIHADYFVAGATVATANTYAIHRDRLAPHDLEDKLRTLNQQAMGLACAARDAHGSGLVAGSLGPLGWSYITEMPFGEEECADRFAEVAQIQAPDADVLLCETQATIATARAAVMGAGVPGKPVWLAVTVNDHDGTKLRSGEPIAELIEALAGQRVDAFLINCAFPEALTQGIPTLPDDRPRGGYGNGFTEINTEFAKAGTTVDLLAGRTDLGPEAYAEHAMTWVRDGATIIGGCCEIGPAHIAEIAAGLDRAGHAITADLP